MAIHRQADYPVVSNPRRWEWNRPGKKNSTRNLMLRTFPYVLLEFIAGTLPEFVLMKMESFAQTEITSDLDSVKIAEKSKQFDRSERNLLQY